MYPNTGKTCGNCIRGNKPESHVVCVACAKVEAETKVPFTKWEEKK